MKTLKELYNALLIDSTNWSYYCYSTPSLEYDTLCDKHKSYAFIEKYFARAAKETVLYKPYIIEHRDVLKNRAPHIVSTYLLGLIIANSLNIDVNSRDNNNVNFKYLWYLACLYHDIGYVYEATSCCEYLKNIQIEGLTAIKEICCLNYLDDLIFKTFTKNQVNIYLSHRAKCTNGKMGVIDHGIVGGLMLYDGLRENYEKTWKTINDKGIKCSREKFCYNGLYFSNKHFEDYALAADAIISHNIWMSTLNPFLVEENMGIIKEPVINSGNSIAFILALADTIEPLKKKDVSILDMIRYETIENGFKLSMPDCNNQNAYSYISDLVTWVDINLKRENNTFFITKKE